jgi:hypothetical protein
MRWIWQAFGWLTAIALASFVSACAFSLGAFAAKSWASFVHLSLGTAVAFTLPFVVTVGLPLALLCRLIGWTGPIAAGGVAFLVGAVGFGVLAPLFYAGPHRAYGLSADLIDSVFRAGACGALGGLAFWATLRYWPRGASKA